MVAVGCKIKIGPGICNPWVLTFLAQNNYSTHKLLARVQKNNKSKYFVAVYWKLKIDAWCHNPWGPFFLPKTIFERELSLLSRAQSNE